jgi:hypothetical protein
MSHAYLETTMFKERKWCSLEIGSQQATPKYVNYIRCASGEGYGTFWLAISQKLQYLQKEQLECTP